MTQNTRSIGSKSPSLAAIRLPADATAAGLEGVATGALIIAALYMGREVFIPVALAILFSFVLAPPVKLLQKIRLPRSIAVIAVVACAFAIIAGLTMAIVGQASQLAGGQSGAHMRYAIKRLRRRVPSACIVVAAFAKEHAVPDILDTSLANHVETTLRGAGKACLDQAALGAEQSR